MTLDEIITIINNSYNDAANIEYQRQLDEELQIISELTD